MPTTVTFKFAFSPKYNLSAGYPYLLLETERDNIESHTLQYDADDQKYNGTCLDLSQIRASVYTVANLLYSATTGTSQIQSANRSVDHISV